MKKIQVLISEKDYKLLRVMEKNNSYDRQDCLLIGIQVSLQGAVDTGEIPDVDYDELFKDF